MKQDAGARFLAIVKRKARVPRDAPESTYSRLLDAAEALFALRGYYGASIRDIAQQAGLQISMATYYFRTKEELFNQVIARRADEHLGGVMAALDAVSARPVEAIALEDVFRAFVAPVVERSVHGGVGWKNYVHLLSRAMSVAQDEPFLKDTLDIYDPLRRKFVDLLRRCRPDASESAVYWSAHFLNSAFAQVLTEGRGIDRLSDGKFRSSDLETMVEEMVPFFVAGFERLIGQDR